MILIGGYTRLTGAGLSITEWKPITGFIPPITGHAWQKLFALYKQSPEYLHHNYNITLHEFKLLFWTEFIHRIAARLTALLYIVPMIFFWSKGDINPKDKLRYVIILSLLLLQGFIGWFMVKSGLRDVPYVSHYRLAIHLLLAFIMYSFIFWQMIENYCDVIIITSEEQKQLFYLSKILYVIIFILFIQIVFGGLVAGLRAGLVYNSFPLMGDQLIPQELMQIDFSFANFHDPVFVQFIHRIIAYILFILAILLSSILIRYRIYKLSKAACYIIFTLFLQMILGILTIIYAVPIWLALMHQIGAILLLSALLYTLFLVKNA